MPACCIQFSDVRILHDIHFQSLVTGVIAAGGVSSATIQPGDYCVNGAGYSAVATTTVNDCYIAEPENWALTQSYAQPCYSPVGSLATMEGCSRRNEAEGHHAQDWTEHFEKQWAPGYVGPDSDFPPPP
jgi:hypothetical protein